MYQQPYSQPYSAYGAYPPQMQRLPPAMDMQRQVTPVLKGRPVTSVEEARASMIDFDGSVFYFPDPSNRRIYTKQINLDGTSTLCTYELSEVPAAPVPLDTNSFVSQDEFQKTINAVLTKINELKEIGDTPNDESKEFPSGG